MKVHFGFQTLLPGASLPSSEENEKDSSVKEKVYDKNLVRSDFKEQKIEKFFQNSFGNSPKNSASTSQSTILSHSFSNIFQSKKFSTENRSDTKLTSVKILRKEFEDLCDRNLKENLGKLTFVGAVSTTQALIQCDTKLFLCDTQKLW